MSDFVDATLCEIHHNFTLQIYTLITHKYIQIYLKFIITNTRLPRAVILLPGEIVDD